MQRLVKVVYCVSGADEEDVMAPVLKGMDEFALYDGLELAVVVIGAECVWMTAVPFSVHKLVYVV